MKRWTTKERRAILKEWESSETTRKEFCKKHGISISSLRHWKEMVAAKDKEPGTEAFIEVDSSEAAVSTPPVKNSSPSTGAELTKFEAQSWIWNAKVAPNGKYLANINWDSRLVVQKVLQKEGSTALNLDLFLSIDLQTSGENLTFSRDSRYLAFSLWDGETYIVNLLTKQVMQLSCLKSDYASTPIFSDDGEYLAIGQDNNAVVYRSKDGKPVQLIRHADRVTSVGIATGSIITGSWDGKVKVSALNLSGKANCSFAK